MTDDATDLSGYRVTFKRTPLGWSWEIETPDEGLLLSDGVFGIKRNAKKNALAAIQRHERTEAVDGNTLRDSLGGGR